MPFSYFFFKRKHFLKVSKRIFLAAGYTFFILEGKTNKVNIHLRKEQERNFTHKWAQNSPSDKADKLNYNLQNRKKFKALI